MGDLVNIITLIRGVPTEFTVALSTFIAILVIWMKSRDVDITAATSISKLQLDQISSLVSQNKQLSEDLQKIRDKMVETYDLMEDMRKQIYALEDLVRDYKRKCDSCPDRLSHIKQIDPDV